MFATGTQGRKGPELERDIRHQAGMLPIMFLRRTWIRNVGLEATLLVKGVITATACESRNRLNRDVTSFHNSWKQCTEKWQIFGRSGRTGRDGEAML